MLKPIEYCWLTLHDITVLLRNMDNLMKKTYFLNAYMQHKTTMKMIENERYWTTSSVALWNPILHTPKVSNS